MEQHHLDAVQSLSKQERKRLQNRVAQRIYRQNQKQRIQALEAAASRSIEASFVSHSILPTSAPKAPSILSIPPISDSIIDTSNPCLDGPDVDTSRIDRDSWEDGCTWTDGSDTTIQARREASPRPGGASALHIAVQTSNDEMVRLLLVRGADVSKQDSEGNTAMHVAARIGHVRSLRTLLDYSAKPDEANFFGQTPLFMAVQSENKDAVQLLLEAMVNINTKDAMGKTILHTAVETGSVPIVDLLLSRGADINA